MTYLGELVHFGQPDTYSTAASAIVSQTMAYFRIAVNLTGKHLDGNPGTKQVHLSAVVFFLVVLCVCVLVGPSDPDKQVRQNTR